MVQVKAHHYTAKKKDVHLQENVKSSLCRLAFMLGFSEPFQLNSPRSKPPSFFFYNSKVSLSLCLRFTSLSMQTPWPPTSPRSWTRTNTVTSFPLPSTCHTYAFKKKKKRNDGEEEKIRREEKAREG